MGKKIIRKTSINARKAPKTLDKKALLEFINSKNGIVTKRDIAHEFSIKGEQRRILNSLLRDLDHEGALEVKRRKDIYNAGVPKSGIYQAIEIDDNGDLWCKAVNDGELSSEKLLVSSFAERGGKAEAVGINERFVGIPKICETENQKHYEIKIIKRIGAANPNIFGVLHIEKGQQVGRIIPADKKNKFEIMIMPANMGKAKNDDLVGVRLLPKSGYGVQKGEITEVFGSINDPKSASILAIAAHNIPTGFSEEEENEATSAQPCQLDFRKDLRHLKLITIDPEDARDHDDAVYAEPTKNGHSIWVAIADVAHYVTPNSALDRGALMRGNSVYFPDRVVPMLPFTLSADLCSLREGEDRACLALNIQIDNSGNLLGFEFYRGLMCSVASLSYSQAQMAIDGKGEDKANSILETVLKPLWGAYSALKIERDDRAPLEITSNERKIVLGENGKVESISLKERFDAHRLIEEFMILANVCAATALENKKAALIYRIHDQPSATKIAALGDFLATLNIKWTKGEVVKPKRFNKMLELAKDNENFQTINEMVLRTQAQAVYDTDNIGHFGLQLHKYAHFTSPIRRYADLCVHRSLIDVLGLGGIGYGETKPQKADLQKIALQISDLERRAMAAERDATDRYLAAFLADRIGAIFEGRITSVTNFGVFVRLDETMGDGLVPVRALGDEYFFHDEASATLVGQYSGDRWQLGMRVKVRLLEAAPISGGLMFDMASEPKKGPPPKGRAKLRGGSKFGARINPSRMPKGVKRSKKR